MKFSKSKLISFDASQSPISPGPSYLCYLHFTSQFEIVVWKPTCYNGNGPGDIEDTWRANPGSLVASPQKFAATVYNFSAFWGRWVLLVGKLVHRARLTCSACVWLICSKVLKPICRPEWSETRGVEDVGWFSRLVPIQANAKRRRKCATDF